MKVGSREFDEIMESFEKIYSYMRLDKEPREMWNRGQVFQCGETNNAYQIFSQGYALGRVSYMHRGGTENV